MSISEKQEMASTKELEDLTKKRDSFKGRMRLFLSFLEPLDIASITPNDISKLELRINRLESLYALYDETQSRLECISDLETQISEREEFESQYFDLITKAQAIVKNHHKSAQPSECGSRSSNNNKPVKLPTIQLPKFSGSYDDWLEFRDTFDSLIHSNEDIDIITKFHYLRASLEGSAALVIHSIQFCALNYSTAWKLVCDKYDNKRLLVQNHVSALFNVDKINRESSVTLKRMLDQFNKSIRALQSLGEHVEHWDTLLIYLLAHKLDFTTFREWEEFKGRLDKELPITLQHFLHFVKIRADILETIEISSQTTAQLNHSTNSKPSKHKAMLSMDSSHNNINNISFKSTSSCPKCSGDHKLNYCPQFLALSNESRLKLMPNYKVCYNCFHSGHYANKCKKSGCKICKRRHNILIHVNDYNALKPIMHSESRTDMGRSTPFTEDVDPVVLSASVSNRHGDGHRVDVLLPTALIKVLDVNKREHTARAVLDSGSTSSLMTSNLFKKLNLPYSHINKSILGISNVTSHISKMCSVPMKSLDGNFMTNLKCFVLPSITNNVPSRSIEFDNFNIPTNLPLADPRFHESAAVDIILGADFFWEVLGIKKFNLGSGKPTVDETKLGWIFSGPVENKQGSFSSNKIKSKFSTIISSPNKI